MCTHMLSPYERWARKTFVPDWLLKTVFGCTNQYGAGTHPKKIVDGVLDMHYYACKQCLSLYYREKKK